MNARLQAGRGLSEPWVSPGMGPRPTEAAWVLAYCFFCLYDSPSSLVPFSAGWAEAPPLLRHFLARL